MQSKVVEFRSNVEIGLDVEQAVDFRNSFLSDLTLLPRSEGQGELDRAMDPGFEAEMERNLLTTDQGDVLQKEPDHPFALAIRRGRVTPLGAERKRAGLRSVRFYFQKMVKSKPDRGSESHNGKLGQVEPESTAVEHFAFRRIVRR